MSHHKSQLGRERLEKLIMHKLLEIFPRRQSLEVSHNISCYRATLKTKDPSVAKDADVILSLSNSRCNVTTGCRNDLWYEFQCIFKLQLNEIDF